MMNDIIEHIIKKIDNKTPEVQELIEYTKELYEKLMYYETEIERRNYVVEYDENRKAFELVQMYYNRPYRSVHFNHTGIFLLNAKIKEKNNLKLTKNHILNLSEIESDGSIQ